MVAGGDAIARDGDGRVVFVAGALPDEQVLARIMTSRRDYARAEVVDVIAPSSLRVSPPCPELARGCGGCPWQHVNLEGQRRLKRDIVTDALKRVGRLEGIHLEPTIELDAAAYRTTIHAAVIDGRAGYRHAGSHDIVDVASCLVAHPLLEDLLVHGNFTGAVEVLLRCGARTGDRLVAPVPADAPITVPDDARPDRFYEIVAGRRWRISAASFFQVRPDGADALAALITSAAAELGEPGIAVDLYSGVGLFAGVLADRGWSVTAVEGSTASSIDARINLADDDCVVVHGDVGTWAPTAADFVVADPSRNGLGQPGVAVVAGTDARRVVLVSCDAAAFARDTALLLGAGYTLTSATPVDMFPHTFHVEVVAVFDRAQSSG
jgi:23S rRNA (uracil1939-C5)-methyltransferase